MEKALSGIFNINGTVRLHGCKAYALREPTLNGSVAVITVEIDDGMVDAAYINELFRTAARNPKYRAGLDVYGGNGGYDSHSLAKLYPITGDIPSSVISPSKTFRLGTRTLQFASWYNNEDAPPLNQAQFTKYALERIASARKAD